MRNSTLSRGGRRDTRSTFNSYEQRDSSNGRNDSNNNNNDDLSNSGYRPRKQHNQQFQQHYQSDEPRSYDSHKPYHHSQDRRDQSGQRDQGSYRERSGQRAGQYPDSSMGREGINVHNTLGSVKFTPGLSTRELPAVETKADPSKKFTGRCRLFVGNLAHNTTEQKVRKLFEPFGEIGELYIGPKSSFAFVKMDTKQNAEAARDALDCTIFEGRALRVRLAAHSAAIRVKNLAPVVTNELLAYAFRFFGEIERAVVVVDDKGKSIGEGIVEYARKQSALFAIKKCQQECFMLTSSPMPVVVEAYDQHDDEEGLPEKSVNKNSIDFKEQRDVGPRFAEQGTFEHSFALKWKDIFNVEKLKRERLEKEIEDGRNELLAQIEVSRLEHDTMQLSSRLQQLEDKKLKLQQMKEHASTIVQQREEQRRHQDLLIRQQEEDVLRGHQMSSQESYLLQQEANLRTQEQVLHEMNTGVDTDQAELPQQNVQQTGVSQQAETGLSAASQMMSQDTRTYAGVTMMGMNQQYMQAQQMATQMGYQAPQAMFSYIPPPTIQPLGASTFGSYQQAAYVVPTSQQADSGERQQKINRSSVNQNNNINVLGNRPRKRGRY